MTDPAYVFSALAVAVAITVALRAVPFVMKRRLTGSALLGDIGQWMPLGAITMLALYCLTTIDVTTAPYGAREFGGVAATVALHLWRRNAVLSITGGTVVYLLIVNT